MADSPYTYRPCTDTSDHPHVQYGYLLFCKTTMNFWPAPKVDNDQDKGVG